MKVIVDHTALGALKDAIHLLYDESVNGSMYKSDMKLELTKINRMVRELSWAPFEEYREEEAPRVRCTDEEMLKAFSLDLYKHYCSVVVYQEGPVDDFENELLHVVFATAGMLSAQSTKLARFTRVGLLDKVLGCLDIDEVELLAALREDAEAYAIKCEEEDQEMAEEEAE